MIIINIKGEDQEKVGKLATQMHDALVGSPAYINSEIAICNFDKTTPNVFSLVIGKDNQHNAEYDLDVNDILG